MLTHDSTFVYYRLTTSGNTPAVLAAPGSAGKRREGSPSFIPTVPGIPRICDTSRAGSAGTSGIGVRVGVWGWENRDTHGGPEQYRPITTGNNFIFTEKPMSKVIKAIHETVVNGKMPSKAIASAIGKPYTTLMRETNPYDPGAKLGVETFMAIIQATGDVGPLELMVQELGYVLQSRK